MRNWKARTCILACIVVVLGSCESKDDPPPPPITIPCNVVIVLKAGESVGNRSNDGCRLTIAEVESYMNALNQKAGFYGANVRFSYNTPFVWGNLHWNARPENFWDWLQYSMWTNVSLSTSRFDPNKINIYFTGLFYANGNPSDHKYNGNTIDPSGTSILGGGLVVRPHILITDRSYSVPGQGPPPGGALVRLSDNILEHEMCHFLIRQQQGVNPPPTRYDGAEHDTVGNRAHLMKPNTPHLSINVQDLRECATRIANGTWLQP